MAQRRTKIEVLNEKISKVDSKIAACTEKIAAPVSYTHLTLPTICSV